MLSSWVAVSGGRNDPNLYSLRAVVIKDPVCYAAQLPIVDNGAFDAVEVVFDSSDLIGCEK